MLKTLARATIPYALWSRFKRQRQVQAFRSTAHRWNRPSRLAGIEYDLDAMKQLFTTLLTTYGSEWTELPSYSEVQRIGFGPGYTSVDALTLYVMMRHLKPSRYLEVGSGVSTYYCSLAAARNAAENRPLKITCVEPYPYEKLSTVPGIELHVKEVQDMDLAVFDALTAGDVLFIDSSHVLAIDGDVPLLFLEVLPRLAAGVIVHIHDVPFPYNFPYPADTWILRDQGPVAWNEAMVVQAFLCGNRNFEVTLSTPLLRHFDEGFLKRLIPSYETIDQNPNAFSSLWIRKVA
jgi:hypothetical protein